MEPYPLQFRPVLKRIIWGGRLLGDRLGKPIGTENDYAESWEVVDHGVDQSVVANGSLSGRTLAQVAAEHRGWLLGQDAESDLDTADSVIRGAFPLLLKYLDCNRVLSVQVHPCDAYGLKMDTPDLGKTEAWYIVAAEPESLIYAGLKPGVDRETFRASIESGRIEETLHSFHPSAGDVVFIPAGTVHALGAGLLVAEIQQSSNTTFRLFDWNRMGADGKPRQLHLDQGIEVADYDSGPVAASRPEPGVEGWQRLVSCDKFVLQVMESGEAAIAGDNQFHIITVPRGSATLRTGQHATETTTEMTAGMTVLLPAAMGRCSVEVSAESTVFAAHLPS